MSGILSFQKKSLYFKNKSYVFFIHFSRTEIYDKFKMNYQ